MIILCRSCVGLLLFPNLLIVNYANLSLINTIHGHKNRIHQSSNEAVMSGWFDSKRPLALSIGMTGISVFCIAFPVKNSPSFPDVGDGFVTVSPTSL